MRYIDEYRSQKAAASIAHRIHAITTRPWVLMEICGGQTHTIVKYGIEELLPPEISLVHGPGCPVCVTPLEIIDKAIAIACRPDVIFTSFGDMLRVPGSSRDLLSVKADGGNVRMVYSPLDAVRIAQQNPDKQVVFFAVGFETTAPANAMAVRQAKREGLHNFSMLASHVLVPPAIRLLLGSPANRVRGFIAPGHVCTVMGYSEYVALAREFAVPIVVGGFEPVDLLEAVLMLVEQLESGKTECQNQYARSVSYEGNIPAQRVMEEVYEVCDRKWRGIGVIPRSGLRMRRRYSLFDAELIFEVEETRAQESPECISAQVLQGLKKPVDCPAFGRRCTPENPLGAPMVSSEGACAAYYLYRRHTAASSLH